MSEFSVLVTAAAFRESGAAAETPLREAGGEVIYPPRMGPLPPDELLPHLRRADAVIAASDPYTGPLLDHCPHLRVIVRWGTGYDQVDLQACAERGILACNAPGQNVEAVADHVFAVMLAAARRLPHQMAVIRSGGWEEVRGVELFRKTLGIVGFGAIGKAVARRGHGFACRILACDPLLTADLAAQHAVEQADLERLFTESDFVTLHATLTPESRGMVGAALISRMKPGAYLINAARGALVDEAALVRALAENRIAGAAIDTYDQEPLPPDHPFRHLPNCLATPHSAFNTVEAAEATNGLVTEQVLAALRGERPRHLLNPDAWTLFCSRPAT